MAYPIHAVTRPSSLSGKSNGRLPSSILFSTPGLAGGPVVRLVAPAARAWRALTAAALHAGHTLKATSVADSYRSYDIQERTFLLRYQTDPLAGQPWKNWNGVRWFQKYNTAVAAVPGTSNHGWGLAVDTGEERDADTGTESIDQATLNWLVAHELSFGFSHELQSEPWHVRYWAGDNIPAAVLAFEESDMTPQQAYVLHVMNYRLEALKAYRVEIKIPAVTIEGQTFPAITETNALAVAVRALVDAADIDPAELAEIKAAAAAGAALGVDAIVAGVLAGLPAGGGSLTPAQVEAALRTVLLTGVDG